LFGEQEFHGIAFELNLTGKRRQRKFQSVPKLNKQFRLVRKWWRPVNVPPGLKFSGFSWIPKSALGAGGSGRVTHARPAPFKFCVNRLNAAMAQLIKKAGL